MPIKIAVYAIALNEIKHVDRWAEATKHADYRIVADTGSTDGTPEALRKHGVSVYDINIKPWRFDDARNAALALVPQDADVCVILDMDEVLDKNFIKHVRNKWQPSWTNAWITMETAPNKWIRDRLHSRHGWRWKYPCHEVQVWYGEGEPILGDIQQAIISHQPDNTKSRGQYLELLKLSVKEYPTDPRMWAYMCREYYFHNQWENCIDAANKMIDLPNGWDVERAAVCRWAGQSCYNLERHDEATKWYDRGVQILPTEGEPWYGIAVDAYRNKDWPKVLDASVRILEMPRSVHHCHESEVWDWKAFDLASIAAWELKQPEEALVFAEHALNGNSPESERIKRNVDFFRKALSELRPHNKGT
mgnify:FL=1